MKKARCTFPGVTYHPILGKIEKGQIIEIKDEDWPRVKMLFEEVKGSGEKEEAPPKETKRVEDPKGGN